MSQKFYKGRTNNHLTWVMVDATDFATPESALSAATKIKIYGKLRGATGVNFVSSGAGSLTNDIQHVGASALGLYTIALAKADLSDASAAWYDQYIISLSATGAAYQTIVVDGGIDDSAMQSRLLVTVSAASDAMSAAQQANSRVLLNQSRISDIASFLVVMSGIQSDIYSALSDFQSDFQSRVPKLVATNSQVSDLHSDLKSYLAVMSGVQSDLYSAVSDLQSDFQSRVPKRVATDSQLSDLASDVKSAVLVVQSLASDAHSAAVQANSRILVVQSQASDLYSLASDLQSDFQSRVPKRVATDSQLSDVHSDLASKIAGITVSVSASDISDIASAVKAILASDLSDILSAAVQTNSRVLVVQSTASDIRSHVSDLQSDFQSRVPKRVATDSQLSDVHSDLKSAIGNITVTIGASDISDIASAVVAALPIVSQVSDIYSLLSDLQSDFQSRVPKRVATDSQLSDLASDVKSAVMLTQSLASDAHSAAAQANSRILVAQSAASDAQSAAAQASSRALAVQSQVSDIYSLLSDVQSDFQSRVPKRVATDSQLSDLHSDIRSALLGLSSTESDIYSLLTAGVEVGASSLSDLRSAITANGVFALGAEPTAVPGPTATVKDKIDWINGLATHRIEQTSVLQRVKDLANTGTVASAAVSDDGTTFVRDSFA